jgi:hypothetical protein
MSVLTFEGWNKLEIVNNSPSRKITKEDTKTISLFRKELTIIC